MRWQGSCSCRALSAELWFVGNPEHLSKEAALQKKICENYGMKFVRNLPVGEYTTIVDAVFGSGLSRESAWKLPGGHRRASTGIRRRSSLWISRPGISSDDGSDPGRQPYRAAVTGALAFRKLGHVLYPGTEYAGRTVSAGYRHHERRLPGGSCRRVQAAGPWASFSASTQGEPAGNKGSFGKACLMAGSRNMAGAAVPFRTGGCPHGNRPGACGERSAATGRSCRHFFRRRC